MMHSYTVTLNTGTMFPQQFHTLANNKRDALDIIADHIEESELRGLYCDWYELADICDKGSTPDQYASAHNLTCAGTHGIYLSVIDIRKERKQNATHHIIPRS